MRSNAIVSCFLLLFHNVCCDQDNWVEPHAWSEIPSEWINHVDSPEDSCKCQADMPPQKALATIEDELALIYFKKFVNSLFTRNKLKYSKASQLYKRSLLFTLTESQVNGLQNIQDVRDFDIMLSKIVEQAKDEQLSSDYNTYSDQGMGVLIYITDIYKDFVQLFRLSEVKFIVSVLVAITIGCAVRKRFRFSVIAVILGGVFLYGYFITYLECNRKLEIESMIEDINSYQKPTNSAEKGWFSSISSYFSNVSPEVQQKQQILKSSKLNIPFCRPDHVLLMYTSEMFLKQIELVLEKTTETISSLTTGLPFPFNLFAPFALVCMIGYLTKLMFKYVISPKAWIGLVRGRSSAPAANAQQAVLTNEASEDRLSGESVKMLLSIISTTNITKSQQQQKLLHVSGVQELLEPHEAQQQPPQALQFECKTNLEKISNESSTVSNCSADIAKEAGFTVVDDNEDDDHIDNL